MARLRVGATARNSISCQTPLRSVSARRSRLQVRAQANENPFVKIGSQLVKAGSQLTETLTGTARIAKKNVVDENVVFVAGATGRLGARAVKECVRAGFTVRAGVRNIDKGNELIETAKQYNVLTPAELKRINLVQYDLLDRDTIAPAIGNAACVVCAIGAPEDKPFDTSAPKKIDGEAAIALVEEAKSSGVKRFLMVTSLGTTKIGWPASALNLFWGVLYFKKLAEQALIKSGMAYTIIRPGGMERPTDTYKETHNTVLYPRDTQFGGQVSRLQVAELIGACVSNPELSGNKTIEVVASEAIPPRPLEELLDGIDAEISLEEMAAKQAEIADLRNRRGALAAEAEELEAQLAEAEERKVLAENEFSTARSGLQEIRGNTTSAQREAADSKRMVETLQERLTSTQRQEAAAKAVLDAQRRAQRSGRLLSAEQIREITEPILNPPADGSSAAPAAGGSAAGFLGGLFAAPKAKEVVQEVEEEVEEVQEEVVAKARGGLGGLLGGLGKVVPKEVQEVVEEVEAEAPPAPTQAAPRRAPAAKKAPQGEEEEEEATQVVKGGGLFGLFQQDTVYADGGAAESGPPAPEVVERAVTKKGSGRKSVKELMGKKAPADDTPAPAAEAPTPPKADEAPKRGGGMFAGLFGGGGDGAKAEEQPQAEVEASEAPKPPAPKPAAKPAAPKPAAKIPAVPADSDDLAAKRSAAVAAALSNLGAAADKAADKAGKEVQKAVPEVKKVAEKAAPEAEKVAEAAKAVAGKVAAEAEKAADKAPAPTQNGAAAAADSVKEAEQWIAEWQSKQKAMSKTRA
eukprot:jgi/Ulvmu1/3823/UM018_0034.1